MIKIRANPPSFGIALAVFFAQACLMAEWPEPEPVDPEVFGSEHDEWRTNRRNRLVSPSGGSVLWHGLWELPQGATSFGSDPELKIVLPPEDSPPLAGTLHRSGQEIRLEPRSDDLQHVVEAGEGGEERRVTITEEMALNSDRTDSTTVLRLGSLGMRIHGEPGTDRLWLRTWDRDHPKRESFQLPEYFPVDPAWRVKARFEPYSEPRPLPLWDVVNGTIEYETPGELVFRRDAREHRLIAVAGPDASRYFILMWDSTATSSTYQGGRYLGAPLADEDGWTTIDFNRAYNPPCVFTAFSTCALPPRENRLALTVSAGEKRPSDSQY